MLDSLEANQEIPQWPPGKAFEHIVLRAFEIERTARVIWPFTVPLQGKVIEQIDGAVYVEGLPCLIETKDYDDPLNIEPIAKLRNQLMRRPSGTMGLVFTMSNFTDPAKSLTRLMNPLSILLWDYHELRYGIENQVMCRGLVTKFMYAVEWRMPDYDIRKELR
jgi:hypothetical protein